jgi:hypothetical protein
MHVIYKGTTPSFSFTLPYTIDEISKMSMVFVQQGKVIIKKVKSDFSHTNKIFIVSLTQQETNLFNSQNEVRVQLKLQLDNTKQVFISDEDTMKFEVKKIYDREIF